MLEWVSHLLMMKSKPSERYASWIYENQMKFWKKMIPELAKNSFCTILLRSFKPNSKRETNCSKKHKIFKKMCNIFKPSLTKERPLPRHEKTFMASECELWFHWLMTSISHVKKSLQGMSWLLCSKNTSYLSRIHLNINPCDSVIFWHSQKIEE